MALPIFVFFGWMLIHAVLDLKGTRVFVGYMASVAFSFLSIRWVVRKIHKNRKHANEYETIFMLFYLLYICLAWLLLWFIVVLSLIKDVLPDNQLFSFFIIMLPVIGLVALLYLMIVPGLKKHDIPKQLWLWFGVLILLIPLVINPVAVKLTKNALKAMVIGGNYPTKYRFNAGYHEQIPPELKNSDTPFYSEELFVVFDIGERMMVRLQDRDDAPVYALPRELVLAQIYFNNKSTQEAGAALLKPNESK